MKKVKDEFNMSIIIRKGRESLVKMKYIIILMNLKVKIK